MKTGDLKVCGGCWGVRPQQKKIKKTNDLTMIDKVHEIIAHGDLNNALVLIQKEAINKKLSKIKDDALIQLFRFNQLNKARLNGTISFDEYLMNQSKIAVATLNILNQIKSDSVEKNNPKVQITITLNKDFDNFDNIDKKKLVTAITNLVEASSGEILIKNIKSGSTIVTLELDIDYCQKLLDSLISNQQINNIDITSVSINIESIKEYEEQNQVNLNQAFESLIIQISNHEISNEQKIIFLNLLIKHSLLHVRNGSQSYLKKALNYYKLGIDRKIIFNREVNSISYNNVLELAIANKEFTWANNFIEEYRGKLNKDKDDMYNLAKARIYLALKEYSKSSKHLELVSPKSSILHLRKRLLSTRLKFEIYENSKNEKDRENLLNEIYIFRTSLRRTKFIPQNEAYLNFLSILLKLVVVISGNVSQTIEIQELDNRLKQKNTVMKGWLASKIDSYR